MIDWTTVAISILGSIGTSGLASWFLIGKRIEKEQEYKQKAQKESWYHQIDSICLRIWRISLEMPYEVPIDTDARTPKDTEEGLEQMAELQYLLRDLLELHTEAPPEVDRSLLDKIEAIGYWYDNIEFNEVTTTTDLREYIQPEIESVMEEIADESERYDEPSYR
jgi:hypothetical protein